MFCKRCGSEFTGNQCPSCHQVHNVKSNHEKDVTSSIFIEADESLISQMSRGYLSNMILGGSFSSDYVLLSNRRVYYSGTFVGRAGANIGKWTGQIILPLQKISSISFLERKNIGLLIFAWILLLTGLVVGVAAAENTEGLSFFAVAPGIFFFILYFLLIKRLFIIASESASIQINYRLYGEEIIRKFAHDLGKTLTSFHTEKELQRL